MEGPSLVILTEELQPFVGKKVLRASGYAKHIDVSRLTGRVFHWVKPWGKQLFYKIGTTIYRTHFGLFGSYRINEDPERNPTLKLEFRNGTVYFLIASVREFSSEQLDAYDWRVDTMSDEWDEDHVLSLLKKHPTERLCDVILDQDLFSGAGNIIKNEVLYRMKLYPLLRVKDLSARKQRTLVRAVRAYCFDFYRWKKDYVLRKNWKVHRRWYCPEEHRLVKKEMGKRMRMMYYCPICQART